MRSTMMKVSMHALLGNAAALRKRIPERVKMLCVVKADAYGHGALPFALELEKCGLADAYAVAIVEEARELREGGIKNMIVVLCEGRETSLREAVRLDVSQAVYTPEAVMVLEDEAKRLGVTAKAHLKVDSGMSRIGVRSADELDRMLETWTRCPHVEMEGCFTHFCAAEEDADFTEKQNRAFEEMLLKIRAAGHSPIAHAAATSAMLDERYQHDMVRAGIGLYGGCMPEMGDAVCYAQTLVTRPVRIERIQPGDTVGYGRTFMAERETVVMTLPIGYGDGYPRILSNRADVLVRGKRAPVIGRVCMDMMMADVTDIPGVGTSDRVVLMGRQGDECITPDELAEHAETIPYEIMLGFLPRIPRTIEN